jgi:hypothetical protein
MRTLKAIWPLFALVLILAYAGDVLACPNCKEAIENQHSPEGAGLRAGYFWSILLMIGTPMGLVSTGFFMVVRAVKRGSLPEL